MFAGDNSAFHMVQLSKHGTGSSFFKYENIWRNEVVILKSGGPGIFVPIISDIQCVHSHTIATGRYCPYH